ncbi:MAG: DsbA family protein [Pseudomonadota bacterium]
MSETPQLMVCIDFKNPYSFLANKPTRALEEKLGIEADWLPASFAPLKKTEPASESDERGKRHRWFRAQYQERDIQRYAEVQGLTIQDIYRDRDVTTAGIGLLWANAQGREVQRKYIDTVFQLYWDKSLYLQDSEAIQAILASSGADTARFKAYLDSDGQEAYAGLQEQLKAAGVFNSPAYIVNGEILIGRQHLPMVEWLLIGAQGEPPI